MSDTRKDTQARRFDMSIDIDAPANVVWSALTEARELTHWFPLEARVVPGEGGSMHWEWGGDWGGESKIAAWEPNRRLKLVETRQGFDADGKPLDRAGDHRDLVVEVTLESHAGTTRVRLVHSGFGAGADWDDELDGVSNGWQIELRCLKDYVEKYRGRDRLFAWARASSDLPQEEVWTRLIGPEGVCLQVFPPEGGSCTEGMDGGNHTEPHPRGFHLQAERSRARYTLNVRDQRFAGDVVMTIPDDFVGYVDDFSGTIRVGTFRGGGRTGLMLVLVSYDPADALRVKAFETDAQALLDRITAGDAHSQR